MRSFDIHECADFLKIHENTVLELAGTGRLRGAKVGRAWVFLEEDLIDFLRAEIEEQTQARLLRRAGAASHSADWPAKSRGPSVLMSPPTAFGARPSRRRNPIPKLPD